jgi:alternative sigma factor RpoH
MMQAAALVSAGTSRYLEEIRRYPMLEAAEECVLATRWREHGDTDAAHKLVTSHLRLVVKIAVGYRGYGLPVSEIISEGNVGLMQAAKRFDPQQGFRFATYAMWWIKAAIHEYILRSWSLVKIGTTANQKKLFFNLRKAKSKIAALEEGDMHPDQVKLIAQRLGVTERDVVEMNRRLGGDVSLNAQMRTIRIPASGRTGSSTKALPTRNPALSRARSPRTARRRLPKRCPYSTRASGASSRHAASRKTRARSRTWPPRSASPASACGRSRCAPSRRCSEPRKSRSPTPNLRSRSTECDDFWLDRWPLPSSSPAKAGDPVTTRPPVITGCPAFAWHDREERPTLCKVITL